LGAIIGRYAGRIAEGKFALNGMECQFGLNDGDHHLHGGPIGFGRKLWQFRTIGNMDGVSLQLDTTSADGEEGFPGQLDVKVVYTLNDNSELSVSYEAVATKSTLVNLTQHLCFNLAGHAQGSILGHQIQVRSNNDLPIDVNTLPDGCIAPVADSPFDVTTPCEIGARIDSDHQQLQYGNGYDHYWLLDQTATGTTNYAVRVVEPKSGRRLSVSTDQAGVVFYSGNFLDGQLTVKGGGVYDARSGFA